VTVARIDRAHYQEAHVRQLRRLGFAWILFSLPTLAQAQDFGVMGSAETINPGNFKLMANPIVVFQDGAADNEFGVSLLAGYGFTDRVDAEFRVAFYDNVSFLGGDVEYWLLKNGGLDLSAAGGFHIGWGDQVPNSKALDLTFVASGHIRPRLELFGAIDVARNWLDIDDRFDNDYTTVHLVPGVEYALSNNLDFVAEIGIGLNDNSSNYVSGGIAFYIR
jgi:hypothetical protein